MLLITGGLWAQHRSNSRDSLKENWTAKTVALWNAHLFALLLMTKNTTAMAIAIYEVIMKYQHCDDKIWDSELLTESTAE